MIKNIVIYNLVRVATYIAILAMSHVGFFT